MGENESKWEKWEIVYLKLGENKRKWEKVYIELGENERKREKICKSWEKTRENGSKWDIVYL